MQKNVDTGTVVPKILLGGSLIVAIVDRIAKQVALTLPNAQNGNTAVQFALFENYGVAFSLPIPAFIVLPATVVIICYFCFLVFKYLHTQKMLVASASITIIGALGNLFDRIVYGFTIDYLIFFGRSAINLSDILILSGVILLIAYNEYRPLTN